MQIPASLPVHLRRIRGDDQGGHPGQVPKDRVDRRKPDPASVYLSPVQAGDQSGRVSAFLAPVIAEDARAPPRPGKPGCLSFSLGPQPLVSVQERHYHFDTISNFRIHSGTKPDQRLRSFSLRCLNNNTATQRHLAVPPSRRPAISPSRHLAVPPSRRPAISPSRHLAVPPSRRPAISPSRRPAVPPSRRPAVPPSRHSAILPFCHSAILPFCHSAIVRCYAQGIRNTWAASLRVTPQIRKGPAFPLVTQLIFSALVWCYA